MDEKTRAVDYQASRTGIHRPLACIPFVGRMARTKLIRDPSATAAGTQNDALQGTPGLLLTWTNRNWRHVICRWLAPWPDV